MGAGLKRVARECGGIKVGEKEADFTLFGGIHLESIVANQTAK